LGNGVTTPIERTPRQDPEPSISQRQELRPRLVLHGVGHLDGLLLITTLTVATGTDIESLEQRRGRLPSGSPCTPRRCEQMTVTIHDLRSWKSEGRRWAMLTAYDFPTAQILDRAGIPVLLVGDSVGRNVLGYANEIPVMAHIGLTPQSVYGLGGYRVQGRGEAAAKVLDQAHSLEKSGAFSIVLEAMPADLGAEIAKELQIPTIGIGAGSGTDAQVLVINDLLGLNEKVPKFAKQYVD